MFNKALILALWVPMAASAQGVVFDPAATETCLAQRADGGDAGRCIGEAANLCMDATPDGASTVGMMACLDQERGYWDARLNAAYKIARAGARATDAEMKEIGSMAPSQADALKAMQRAWISYRDTTCVYEQSLWGGGTGGGPAVVSCHMQMTGEQALYLEAMGGVN